VHAPLHEPLEAGGACIAFGVTTLLVLRRATRRSRRSTSGGPRPRSSRWGSSRGHDVAVAHDGPAGLAAARALSGAVLVAPSGYAAPEDVRRASQAGFARHLAKPASLDALEEVIASAGAPA
jgi:hypothetical protein